MFETIKQTFEDIRNAIIEKGVDVDYCDSPTTYAKKILSIPQEGGVSMLLIPVFKSSETKPERPAAQMSIDDPTGFPEGWGTPDGLTDNIWMSYTLVGKIYVFIPWTDPILINGEYKAPAYKNFTIFGEISSLDLNPSVPVGGTWDVPNDRLVGDITSTLSNGNTLTWSTRNTHQDGLYTYVSNCTFSSENGLPVGDWSYPYCINSIKNGIDGVGVRSMTTYYIGSSEEHITIPLEEQDPIDHGWTTDSSEITLSENLVYLWEFTRIVYTDNTVWQSNPTIVRTYIYTDYQKIIDELATNINEEIVEILTRLGTVENTDALIKQYPEKGLIELLTNYKDSDGSKNFADFTANAADAAIKQSVGSALGHDITGVEATLDGVNALLKNQVTKISELESGVTGVKSSIQKITEDSITNTVSAGTLYWQKQNWIDGEWINDEYAELIPYTPLFYASNDPAVIDEDDPNYPKNTSDIKNDRYHIDYIDGQPVEHDIPEPPINPTTGSVQYVKREIIDRLSSIKQTANSILLAVGDEGSGKRAAISVIANSSTIEEGGKSKIILDADNVRVTGGLTAESITTPLVNTNAITADMINVEDLYVQHLNAADGIFNGVIQFPFADMISESSNMYQEGNDYHYQMILNRATSLHLKSTDRYTGTTYSSGPKYIHLHLPSTAPDGVVINLLGDGYNYKSIMRPFYLHGNVMYETNTETYWGNSILETTLIEYHDVFFVRLMSYDNKWYVIRSMGKADVTQAVSQ